jgi:SAM-dependent methyltransferase
LSRGKPLHQGHEEIMAKIEFIKKETDKHPQSVERIEVTVWGLAGKPTQDFYIGSGENFNASGNFWLEICYSVQDIPIFYTRSILLYIWPHDSDGLEAQLNKFLNNNEMDYFRIGDDGPTTGIYLLRKRYNHQEENGEITESFSYTLKITADISAIFGQAFPGDRVFDICFPYMEVDEALPFLNALIREFEDAIEGNHPDPAIYKPLASNWPFARELSRRAYNQVGERYAVNYFTNPTLVEAFNIWFEMLPTGGHILDAGCGHGQPVITTLLENGFQVTGCDLSPVMLALAREQFPGVEFWEQAIMDIESESVFDGACSFSSMLFLDPIDFFHSIHRLHCAIKPGGVLLLYGLDQHPAYRGHPYDYDLGQWMWRNTYGIDEAAKALEEHGYFKVLKTLNVTSEEMHRDLLKSWQPDTPADDPSGFDPRLEEKLPYYYVVIAENLKK